MLTVRYAPAYSYGCDKHYRGFHCVKIVYIGGHFDDPGQEVNIESEPSHALAVVERLFTRCGNLIC